MDTELFRDEEFEGSNITEFDLFEALDRTHMVILQLDASLFNHPGLNAEQAAMVEQASRLLSKVYQLAGHRFYETQPE